jgi:cytochrome c oxidase cbb3-type subunit I/II
MDAEHDTGAGTDVGAVEHFSYDDAIVRKFVFVTWLWGFVAMLVGVIVSVQLVAPALVEWKPGLFGWLSIIYETSWLNFGRLRPLHTNAAIFAFVGNMLFAGVYYSTQRLCKARMFSDTLSNLTSGVGRRSSSAAAITCRSGITQGKEYAELEWPIDLAIAVIWVVFAINFFWTLAKRNEKTPLRRAVVLHRDDRDGRDAAHRQQPRRAGRCAEVYSVYAGAGCARPVVVRAQRRRLLPDDADPRDHVLLPAQGGGTAGVFSYRLSIVHFWALVFIYIWAGPHHLLYTAFRTGRRRWA